MARIEVRLDAGDVLHIWLKAAVVDRAPEVTVGQEGASTVLTSGPGEDFAFASHEAALAGPASITWDETATEVSLVYAFSPADAMERGVRLLWTTARNAASPARHRLHLRPPWGWMNDPNGCCQIDGVTHVFYQHYPHARRWSRMHWGHAVSRNLVDWVHLPVFLLPREELTARGKRGGAYSGSVIPERLGLRVVYTDRQDDREPNWEWQMTAAAPDGLTAGPARPLITERPALPGYGKDFRDPYVFRGPDGRWKMLLGGGDEGGAVVLLYDCADPAALEGWTLRGVLHREPTRGAVPAECPCMIELDGEGRGLCALIFGLIGSRDEATRRRNLSYAIVGRFDGTHFAPEARFELDVGTDAYAFQAFRTDQGPHAIAWAANWADVPKDRDFPSAMTFVRRLVWRDGRLHTPPALGVATLRADILAEGSRLLQGPVALPTGLGELELALAVPGTPFALSFSHPSHRLGLTYDGDVLDLRFEPPGNRVIPRYRVEGVALSRVRVLIDVGLIEIYADDGRWCITKRIDSDEPIRAIELTADAASLARGQVWELRESR